MPELTDLRIRAFRRLMQIVERVFALCEWTRELLIRNCVPQDKISLCRQGISWAPNNSLSERPARAIELPLRAAFLGRFDETKGVHIVAQALKDNRTLPLYLDLFGVRQGEAGDQYASRIHKVTANDPRIRVLPPLPSGEVIPRLRDYDLLVVPSQWLETGPLVVLEAFAAGTPVMGSDLGGIAELVNNGVDGLLVNPAHSPTAWADAFRQICSNPDRLVSLRAGIRPPRHTRQVAVEMIPLYAHAMATRTLKLAARPAWI
jgi:glycosyltransferase involved in cell wall biosynthesis